MGWLIFFALVMLFPEYFFAFLLISMEFILKLFGRSFDDDHKTKKDETN